MIRFLLVKQFYNILEKNSNDPLAGEPRVRILGNFLKKIS